jgi:hypothetical protein
MIGRGYRISEAAKTVRRNPRTVTRWNSNPDFRAAVQAARDQLLSEQPDAEGVLRQVMNDPTAPVTARVSAARTLLLNRKGNAGDKPEEKVRETTIYTENLRK